MLSTAVALKPMTMGSARIVLADSDARQGEEEIKVAQRASMGQERVDEQANKNRRRAINVSMMVLTGFFPLNSNSRGKSQGAPPPADCRYE